MSKLHKVIRLLAAVSLALAVPGVASAHKAPAEVDATRIVQVPILMYHYIRINPKLQDRVGADLSVPPDQFYQQMQLLASHRFHTISIDDLVAAILQGAELPSRPVILTFDDGYEDFYTTAFPVLRQFGLSATSFIITGKVGRGGYLTWDQMREMQSSGLVQFESHTVDHVEMNRVALARAQYELADSKAALEAELGVRVDVFCYPSGRYDAQVEALLTPDGYIAGVGTRPGVIHNVSDLDALARVRVRGSDTLRDFGLKVGVLLPAIAAHPITGKTKGAALAKHARTAPYRSGGSRPRT